MHYPLLFFAIFGLLAAMWAGLLRLGWNWPPLQPTLPMAHGPLMVGGFLGTVIGLERAVGLGKRWALGAPLCTALGLLLLIAGIDGVVGPFLITIGSLWLSLVLLQIVRIHLALFSGTIAAGGWLFFVGNLLWLSGWLIPHFVLWWIGFLVLTIVGERLELSRVAKLDKVAYVLFTAGIGLFAAGLVATFFNFDLAMRVAGIGMIALSLWLLYFDVARRRIKAGGQARFIALTLLAGYLWLGIGGFLAIWHGGVMAGPHYDALIHAIFLGFVMSMIFAHAPIVFPALLHRTMHYSDRFYIHTVLLHFTLALRILGDLQPWWDARLWGGLLNAIVLLLFVVNTVLSLHLQSALAFNPVRH